MNEYQIQFGKDIWVGQGLSSNIPAYAIQNPSVLGQFIRFNTDDFLIMETGLDDPDGFFFFPKTTGVLPR